MPPGGSIKPFRVEITLSLFMYSPFATARKESKRKAMPITVEAHCHFFSERGT
jgi:hypothetical protein